jgi:hypothetical protein
MPMIELLDFQVIKESSEDPNELTVLLTQLLGQPFLFFRVSYGDELALHLGESREYSHPKMKHLRKGSYILSARASAWYMRPDSQPIMYAGAGDLTDDATSVSQKVDIREIESRPLVKPGEVVARVDLLPSSDGFGLALVLSDRSTLIIVPPSAPPSMDADDDEEDNVADWELFTPYHRYLRVGPGPRWAYLADDKPTSK